MTQRVDAAIVGGGPAGAIIARQLALKSWRVMLIERGAPFRTKTCGHCLAPRTLPILKDQGLLALAQRLAVGRTTALRVHAAQRRCMTASLGGSDQDSGLLVRRDQFDQAMRDAASEAGASVVQPAAARVAGIDDHSATLRITTATQAFDVRCGLLIGADGLGSAVARAAGLVHRHAAGRKYGFSLTIPDGGESMDLGPDSIEMFLLEGGYIGAVTQANGHVHLAALVGRADGQRRASPADVLAEASSTHPMLARVLRRASIDDLARHAVAAGPMPWRTRGVATGRVAFVGDAAGYIEPFTGEGMTWAMESATLLGRSIESCGGAWNAAAADIYARMWNQRIARSQRLCRWLSAALERPMISRMLRRVAASAPSLTGRLVRRAVAA